MSPLLLVIVSTLVVSLDASSDLVNSFKTPLQILYETIGNTSMEVVANGFSFSRLTQPIRETLGRFEASTLLFEHSLESEEVITDLLQSPDFKAALEDARRHQLRELNRHARELAVHILDMPDPLIIDYFELFRLVDKVAFTTKVALHLLQGESTVSVSRSWLEREIIKSHLQTLMMRLLELARNQLVYASMELGFTESLEIADPHIARANKLLQGAFVSAWGETYKLVLMRKCSFILFGSPDPLATVRIQLRGQLADILPSATRLKMSLLKRIFKPTVECVKETKDNIIFVLKLLDATIFNYGNLRKLVKRLP